MRYDGKGAVKKIEQHNQLSVLEREELQKLISEETRKYDLIANERFDSEKNWSIMIDRDQNEIRNNVMRKFKSRQLKRRNLHNFIREKREELIKKRHEKEEEQALSKFSQDGLSTAADTSIKLDGIKNKEQLQN